MKIIAARKPTRRVARRRVVEDARVAVFWSRRRFGRRGLRARALEQDGRAHAGIRRSA
ncbi:MAG: hypothetical protein AAFW46_04600 [Pseudomonadota bacterium]